MNFYECELQTNDIAAIKLVLECLRVKKMAVKKKREKCLIA